MSVKQDTYLILPDLFSQIPKVRQNNTNNHDSILSIIISIEYEHVDHSRIIFVFIYLLVTPNIVIALFVKQ